MDLTAGVREGEFVCNICASVNPLDGLGDGRERASCMRCGSSVRARGIVHVLSTELFGESLPLPDFPRVKSLRGIGISDANTYAAPLAEKFDYRNTFFDREPRFDITAPADEEFDQYDFLISSEVFEHVRAPVETTFRNSWRLLKPGGVMVLTTPYSLESTTIEHYPDLHEYGFAEVGGRVVLVNRTRAGELQVFENVVFHGGLGSTLEMREFNEADLKSLLTAAGFSGLRIYGEDQRKYGIAWGVPWSLPIAARKGEFALRRDAASDLVREWRALKEKFNAEMSRLNGSWWYRIGRKLRFL